MKNSIRLKIEKDGNYRYVTVYDLIEPAEEMTIVIRVWYRDIECGIYTGESAIKKLEYIYGFNKIVNCDETLAFLKKMALKRHGVVEGKDDAIYLPIDDKRNIFGIDIMPAIGFYRENVETIFVKPQLYIVRVGNRYCIDAYCVYTLDRVLSMLSDEDRQKWLQMKPIGEWLPIEDFKVCVDGDNVTIIHPTDSISFSMPNAKNITKVCDFLKLGLEYTQSIISFVSLIINRNRILFTDRCQLFSMKYTEGVLLEGFSLMPICVYTRRQDIRTQTEIILNVRTCISDLFVMLGLGKQCANDYMSGKIDIKNPKHIAITKALEI